MITDDDAKWIDDHVYECPMKLSHFKTVIFKDEHIEQFKNNKPNWKARFDSEHRWIGQIGEAAFKKYMTINNATVIDKTKDGPSWTDFIYPKQNYIIDVKTVGTKVPPTLDYACNVDEDQEEENTEANVYVFTRFVIPDNRVYLLGFIKRNRFKEDAIYRKQGVKITDSFTPTKSFYEIPIYKLERIENII